MQVLVTNDDGIESPLLEPFLDAIAQQRWCDRVTAVVPAENQSWIAMAHTRKGVVYTDSVIRGRHTITTVSGTPADCTALAIGNLLPEKPDLVLSGINLGTNAGLGFYCGSGTIGGALMGRLFGIPSVAVSADMPRSLFQLWNSREIAALGESKGDWERLAKVSAKVLSSFVERLPLPEADFYSINVPFGATEQTSSALTYVEPFTFQSLFAPTEGGGFKHLLAPVLRTQATGHNGLEPDFTTVERGIVSITAVRFAFGEKFSDETHSPALDHPSTGS